MSVTSSFSHANTKVGMEHVDARYNCLRSWITLYFFYVKRFWRQFLLHASHSSLRWIYITSQFGYVVTPVSSAPRPSQGSGEWFGPHDDILEYKGFMPRHRFKPIRNLSSAGACRRSDVNLTVHVILLRGWDLRCEAWDAQPSKCKYYL